MARTKKPCIYVVIDQGMIWEAYSDQPVELIINNADRQWLRHLETSINIREIKSAVKLLKALEEENIKLPGQAKAERKHLKVRRLQVKPLKSGNR